MKRKLAVLLREREVFDPDERIQNLTSAANIRGAINTDLTDTPAGIVPQLQLFKVAMNTHSKGHSKSSNSQQFWQENQPLGGKWNKFSACCFVTRLRQQESG